jgi:hypothetical protein
MIGMQSPVQGSQISNQELLSNQSSVNLPKSLQFVFKV